MPELKHAIALRHGLALDPNPSRNAPPKFQSFERSLRELESAIGDTLTMSKLRAILPTWVSPSRLDDRQVIHQIATMVAQGTVVLVSWPAVVLFESGREITTKLSASAPVKLCKCFNVAAFAKALDTNADGRTASIGLCGRYVGLALIAGGATTVGLHNGGDYGPYLIKAGFAAVSATGYSAQMGDVVIFAPTATHAAGHAAGFDGTQWVSDYLQRRANPYRIASSAGACTYYRIVCKCS
jgi:hypothetical protein